MKIREIWPWLVVFTVLALLALMATVIDLFSYGTQKERLLNRFADGKEKYGMLLSGYACYQGDTVFFDLLPAVQFAIDPNDKDVIKIKTRIGGECQFVRRMRNMWHVPNPVGKGKAMEPWVGGPDEKSFFAAFKRVVKNGTCIYDFGLATEQALKDNFVQTYGLDEKKAAHFASLARRPIFSLPGRLRSGNGNVILQ